MDKINIAYQEANERIITVFDRYPEEIAASEVFVARVAEFRIIVDEISNLSVEIGKMPPITATDKNVVRTNLQTTCVNVGSQMLVLALELDDTTLQNFIITKPSTLHRYRSTDFSIYSKSLLKYVVDYSEQIPKVGITEASVAQLTEETESYSNLIEDPKDQINKHKILLNTRNQKIHKSIELIHERFDLLIKGYPSDSDFVLDYKAASKVVDPITIHRKKDDTTEEEE